MHCYVDDALHCLWVVGASNVKMLNYDNCTISYKFDEGIENCWFPNLTIIFIKHTRVYPKASGLNR
jgi:hypothetical protein